MKTLVRVLVWLASSTFVLHAQIIPTNRLVTWTPGVTVGVPGGIPTNRTVLIDVTQSPFNADKTGVTNAITAIQNAVNSATANQVVYIPDGVYKFDGTLQLGNNNPQSITLRGQSTNAVLRAGVSQGQIHLGANSTANSFSTNTQVISGQSAGSSNVTFSSSINTSDYFTVGHMVQFGIANGSNPLNISVSGYDLAYGSPTRNQWCLITALTAHGMTFWPPLYSAYGGALMEAVDVPVYAKFNGVENLTMDLSANTAGTWPLYIEQSYGCWLSNVVVYLPQKRSVFMGLNLQCEMRHCFFNNTQQHGPGDSNGGQTIQGGSGMLVVDNIVYNAFPGFEINAISGSMVAYNFITHDIGMVSIDSNHSPTGDFNLYEGNDINYFQSDGYFGGVTTDTVFRNWINGYGTYFGLLSILSESTNGFSYKDSSFVVNLNRFTYDYSVVGNILQASDSVFHSGDAVFFGEPNIGQPGNPGNGGFAPPWSVSLTNYTGIMSIDGTGVNVSTTVPVFNSSEVYNSGFTQWQVSIPDATSQNRLRVYTITAYTDPQHVQIQQAAASLRGQTGLSFILGNGQAGFQENDTNVLASLVRSDNYNFNSGIDVALGGNTLSNSMAYTVKPDWFYGLPWPPFDPNHITSALSHTNIPAGYRYVFRVDPPSSGNTAPSISVQPANLTITAGQSASFTVTATGTAPLAYQWALGGSNIAGATASAYSFSNAQSGNAGGYRVVITNVAGTVTSSTATLTVNANTPSPYGTAVFQ